MALTVTADTTNESSYGANDGSVVLEASGGTSPYFYSVDGINFYTEPSFAELAPGNYTASVQDDAGEEGGVNFTISAASPVLGCTDPTAVNYNPSANFDDGTCIYSPQDDPADSRGNLYEETDQFRLIDKLGKNYLIEMPRGWENVTFILARDKQYHGVSFEFSDGAVQLDFDLPAGKEILQTEYDKNGNDGYMRFQFGVVTAGGAFTPDVDAFIDFNTKTNDRDFFSASVKNKHFNDAIETKNEIDVTLKSGYFTLPLHSKTIRRVTNFNRGFQSASAALGKNEMSVNLNANGPGDAPFLTYWTYLDFSQPSEADPAFSSFVNDLAQNPSPPQFGVGQIEPIPSKLYIFKSDGAGSFDFEVDFSGYLNVKLNKGRIGYFSYTWYLAVNDVKTELPGRIEGFVGGNLSVIGIQSTKYTTTLNLNQGDEVYLYGQFVCEKRGGPSTAQIDYFLSYSNLRIEGDTLATPTTTQAKLSFEVGQGILDSISNNTAKLVSNLLGRTDLGYEENGAAALIAYTNGYLIRGFQLADTPALSGRPLVINLKDFIEGLDANYAIGMGYELDARNNYVYRLEQFEYFYKDVLIEVFQDVSDYNEEIDAALIFNQLDFGYNKYTQDLQDVSTLDEFLTRHAYNTPIESYKATLTKICKQIAAGYAIELTRRKQYSLDTNGSTSYDEDNFIISCIPGTDYPYQPEKLENFTASGIIGPDTVYNLRFTISRMLARWAQFINSGLAFKTNAAVIVNTYVSKNGKLVSQYTGSDPLETTQQFVENNNLFKGDLQAGTQIFFPEKIQFKTKLSWDGIREIKRCFINKDTNGKNNGYFGVVDGDGVTKYGYLISLNYNPNNEEVTFILRKKYVDLNAPFDCSQYSNYTFADFEAATGLPIEIEQCLFQNFA